MICRVNIKKVIDFKLKFFETTRIEVVETPFQSETWITFIYKSPDDYLRRKIVNNQWGIRFCNKSATKSGTIFKIFHQVIEVNIRL